MPNSPIGDQDNWFGSMWSRVVAWIEAHPFQALAVLVPIISTLAVGILQEIANRIVDTEIAPWLGAVVSVYRWIVAGMALLLIMLGVIIWQQSLRHAKHMNQANAEAPAATHQRMLHALAQLGLVAAHFKTSSVVIETLTQYLASRRWDAVSPEELQRILVPIIAGSAQRMYSHQHLVQRACVFIPSHEQPDYLAVYWASDSGSGHESAARWYVGNDRNKRKLERGTAGDVFIRRKPQVRHIDPDTHQAKEGHDYIPSRKPGEKAMYESFVAMPLLDGGKCLGVLCLDSLRPDTFDDDPMVVLEPTAKLLVQVFKLRQKGADSE